MSPPIDKREETSGSSSSSFLEAALIETYDTSLRRCRQGEVLLHGTLSASSPSRVLSEIKKAPVESSLNAVTSAVLGFGLAALQKKCGLAGAVIGGITGLIGVKALADTGMRLSKDSSLQSALKTAWLHGDKANMQKSKELATQIMAPEVAQLEIGAVSGGLGFGGQRCVSSLRDRGLTKSWSSLLKGAINRFKKRTTSEHATAASFRSNEYLRDKLHFDERGDLLLPPTNKEQAAILDTLKHMNELGNIKLRFIRRLEEYKDAWDLQIGLDRWELPDYERTGMLTPEIAKMVEADHGIKIRIDEPRSSSGIKGKYLGTEFVPENLISIYKHTSMLEPGETVTPPVKGIDEYHRNLPIARINDVERLVLEGFLTYVKQEQLPVTFSGAHRSMGPNSGRGIESLIVEFNEDKSILADSAMALAQICERLYKQFRCRVGYRSVSEKQHGFYDTGSVPLDVRCLSGIFAKRSL